MALTSVVESLDGLDEAAQSLYAETDDGKYVLQVEGIDQHPDVANLKSAYERVKADKKTAAEERDAFKQQVEGLPEDFDPDEWKKLKEGKGKADPEDLVQLRRQLESERDEWKGKYDTLVAESRQKAIRDAVQGALAQHGVPEGARRGAALDMMDGKKVEMQGDQPMIDTDMGPMSVADYAKRWIGKEGQAYVTPASGGGAKGGDGKGGSITKEQFAAMGDQERVQLFHDDPETFRRMAGT